jgi:predicted metal-dependent peptidase
MVSKTPSNVIAAMEKALVYIADNIPEYYPFSYFLKTTPIVYKKDVIAATDGRRIFVGDKFMDLSFEEQLFVVIHELWHIIARDAFRSVGKDHFLWNVASDIKNNQSIVEQLNQHKIKGVKIVDGVLIDPHYAANTRETVYDILYEMCNTYGYFEIMGEKFPCKKSRSGEGQEEEEQGKGKRGQGQGQIGQGQRGKIPREEGQEEEQEGEGQGRGISGKIPWEKEGQGTRGVSRRQPQQGRPSGGMRPLDYPLSDDVIENRNEEDERDVVKRIEKSIKEYQEKSQGKGIPEEYRKYVDMPYNPKVPWQSIVQIYFQRIAATDYTWRKPKMLYGVGYGSENTYLPRLRQRAIRIVIAMDTSGSIDAKEVNMFMKEIGRLMSTIFFGGTVDGALLLTTDVVYDYIRIPPIPVISNVQKRLKEGGTSFVPAFKWVSDHYRDDIDLFIYFTDAYGDYPENPPRYPVLWIVTTDLNELPKKYYPPFGNVIQL